MNDLAQKVQKAGKNLGLTVEIQHIANPRLEAEDHYYNPAHKGLQSLGLKPHYLDEPTLVDMLDLIQKYRGRIEVALLLPQVKWGKNISTNPLPENSIERPVTRYGFNLVFVRIMPEDWIKRAASLYKDRQAWGDRYAGGGRKLYSTRK